MSNIENIEFQPDYTVGDLLIYDGFYNQSHISTAIDNRRFRLYSYNVDEHQYINIPTPLSTLTIVTLSGGSSNETYINDDPLPFYMILDDNINALSCPIVNVADPIEDTDCANKKYVDNAIYDDQFPHSTFYYAQVFADDQANYIHWGTFCLSDYNINDYKEDSICEIKSLAIAAHSQQYFSGIKDAYLGIYEYIDDNTEPDSSHLIAQSINSYTIESLTANSQYETYKYQFNNLSLIYSNKYVYRFTNKNQTIAILSTDSHGSFMSISSSNNVMHFGRVLNGVYYNDYKPNGELQHYMLYFKFIEAINNNSLQLVYSNGLSCIDAVTHQQTIATIKNNQWSFSNNL